MFGPLEIIGGIYTHAGLYVVTMLTDLLFTVYVGMLANFCQPETKINKFGRRLPAGGYRIDVILQFRSIIE